MEAPKLDFNVKVPNLTYKADKAAIDVRYPLISPYANAHVYWDSHTSEMVYELEEPLLTDSDKKNLESKYPRIAELPQNYPGTSHR